MNKENLKYFKIAKELNKKYHDELVKKQLHFRGNINSFSIVSVSQINPELGKSGLTSFEKGKYYLKNLSLEKEPGRKTEEKNLQAFIINHAFSNNGILPEPLDDLMFVTSEMAVKLENNKRIVNDILAIDSNNNLAIIELKSLRNNKVKQQTIDFEEKVVIPKINFIKELVLELTGKTWNGNVRKIAVWKAPLNQGNIRPNKKHSDVELYNYKYEGVEAQTSLKITKLYLFKELIV